MNEDQATAGRRVQRRYSAKERERLIEECKASGKSRQVFCEEYGLKLTTFYGWLKKAERASACFAKVEVSPPGSLPIEIVLPNGIKLGIYLNGKQDDLVGLIRGVLGC